MAVHTHLPRAVGAGRVVADEPAGVVFGGLKADGVLELGNDSQGRKHPLAGFRRADNAFGIDIIN